MAMGLRWCLFLYAWGLSPLGFVEKTVGKVADDKASDSVSDNGELEVTAAAKALAPSAGSAVADEPDVPNMLPRLDSVARQLKSDYKRGETRYSQAKGSVDQSRGVIESRISGANDYIVSLDENVKKVGEAIEERKKNIDEEIIYKGVEEVRAAVKGAARLISQSGVTGLDDGIKNQAAATTLKKAYKAIKKYKETIQEKLDGLKNFPGKWEDLLTQGDQAVADGQKLATQVKTAQNEGFTRFTGVAEQAQATDLKDYIDTVKVGKALEPDLNKQLVYIQNILQNIIPADLGEQKAEASTLEQRATANMTHMAVVDGAMMTAGFRDFKKTTRGEEDVWKQSMEQTAYAKAVELNDLGKAMDAMKSRMRSVSNSIIPPLQRESKEINFQSTDLGERMEEIMRTLYTLKNRIKLDHGNIDSKVEEFQNKVQDRAAGGGFASQIQEYKPKPGDMQYDTSVDRAQSGLQMAINSADGETSAIENAYESKKMREENMAQKQVDKLTMSMTGFEQAMKTQPLQGDGKQREGTKYGNVATMQADAMETLREGRDSIEVEDERLKKKLNSVEEHYEAIPDAYKAKLKELKNKVGAETDSLSSAVAPKISDMNAEAEQLLSDITVVTPDIIQDRLGYDYALKTIKKTVDKADEDARESETLANQGTDGVAQISAGYQSRAQNVIKGGTEFSKQLIQDTQVDEKAEIATYRTKIEELKGDMVDIYREDAEAKEGDFANVVEQLKKAEVETAGTSAELARSVESTSENVPVLGDRLTSVNASIGAVQEQLDRMAMPDFQSSLATAAKTTNAAIEERVDGAMPGLHNLIDGGAATLSQHVTHAVSQSQLRAQQALATLQTAARDCEEKISGVIAEIGPMAGNIREAGAKDSERAISEGTQMGRIAGNAALRASDGERMRQDLMYAIQGEGAALNREASIAGDSIGGIAGPSASHFRTDAENRAANAQRAASAEFGAFGQDLKNRELGFGASMDGVGKQIFGADESVLMSDKAAKAAAAQTESSLLKLNNDVSNEDMAGDADRNAKNSAGGGKRVNGIMETIDGSVKADEAKARAALEQETLKGQREMQQQEGRINAAGQTVGFQAQQSVRTLDEAMEQFGDVKRDTLKDAGHVKDAWSALKHALGGEEATIDQKAAALPKMFKQTSNAARDSSMQGMTRILTQMMKMMDVMGNTIEKSVQRNTDQEAQATQFTEHHETLMQNEHIKRLDQLRDADVVVQSLLGQMDEVDKFGLAYAHHATLWRGEVAKAFASLNDEFYDGVDGIKGQEDKLDADLKKAGLEEKYKARQNLKEGEAAADNELLGAAEGIGGAIQGADAASKAKIAAEQAALGSLEGRVAGNVDLAGLSGEELANAVLANNKRLNEGITEGLKTTAVVGVILKRKEAAVDARKQATLSKAKDLLDNMQSLIQVPSLRTEAVEDEPESESLLEEQGRHNEIVAHHEALRQRMAKLEQAQRDQGY